LKLPRIPPALALFLLSPMIGELLSGSAPPAEFFTGFGFTVMSLLYGGGAVLARELKNRWRKGVGSLLFIGAAYGIIEEGVMVVSFQNPNWIDVGVLGSFGRWMGVNWVWAVELTIYHAIVSITVPVMLVELVYPLKKAEPWLSGCWRQLVPLLFLGDVGVGYFLFATFTGYAPPFPQLVLFIFMSIIFLYLAYLLPSDWLRKGNQPMRDPRYYFIVTFIGSIASGFVFGVLPERLGFSGAPILVIALGIGVIFGIFRILVRFNWSQATPLHYHRLLFGSLFLFIIASYLQEMDASRLDDTTGMSIVGTVFLLGFLWLGCRIKQK
jgi:hypothetical protein